MMKTGRWRAGPDRLAEKLCHIRRALELSQAELVSRLGYDGELMMKHISQFETGMREPPLPILLKYARAAGVWAEVLVDDELDLPRKLPASAGSDGPKRKTPPRKRS